MTASFALLAHVLADDVVEHLEPAIEILLHPGAQAGTEIEFLKLFAQLLYLLLEFVQSKCPRERPREIVLLDCALDTLHAHGARRLAHHPLELAVAVL